MQICVILVVVVIVVAEPPNTYNASLWYELYRPAQFVRDILKEVFINGAYIFTCMGQKFPSRTTLVLLNELEK